MLYSIEKHLTVSLLKEFRVLYHLLCTLWNIQEKQSDCRLYKTYIDSVVRYLFEIILSTWFFFSSSTSYSFVFTSVSIIVSVILWYASNEKVRQKVSGTINNTRFHTCTTSCEGVKCQLHSFFSYFGWN